MAIPYMRHIHPFDFIDNAIAQKYAVHSVKQSLKISPKYVIHSFFPLCYIDILNNK